MNTRTARPFLYHPYGRRMWDAWMLHRAGVTHAFHLMAPWTPDEADTEQLPLGHATSTDLLDWREEPAILPPGPALGPDDMQHWTGDAIEHDGEIFVYYTGRSTRERGLVQRTMLARTRDLVTWQRSNQPVMEADGRWYLAEPIAERAHTVSWRDPKIVFDTRERVWHAFLAADTVEGPFAARGCIARARSSDPLHWTVLPPALAPGRYACLEVPDVFELGGRWYLSALTGTQYGNARDAIADRHVTTGTIFAVADTLDGPFVEVPDNVLIGSATMDGSALRTVEVDGVRYAYYWLAEREGGIDSGRPSLGVLGTPKVVAVDAADRLVLRAAPQTDALFGDRDALGVAAFAGPRATLGGGSWRLSGEELEIGCEVGWTVCCAGPMLESFSLSVQVRATSGSTAGVLVRAQPFADHPAPHQDQGALAVLLDFDDQTLRLCRLRDFLPIAARTVALAPDRTHSLRVVALGEFLEVYLDDALMLNTVRYEFPVGRVGLYVEQGRALFRDLELRPSDRMTAATGGKSA